MAQISIQSYTKLCYVCKNSIINQNFILFENNNVPKVKLLTVNSIAVTSIYFM